MTHRSARKQIATVAEQDGGLSADEGNSNASPANSASPLASPSLRPSIVRHRSSQAHHRMASLSDGYGIDTPRAGFSLLGAIEFRDVVNNLKRESASRSPSPGRSPHLGYQQDYFGTYAGPSHHRSQSHQVSNRNPSPNTTRQSRSSSSTRDPPSHNEIAGTASVRPRLACTTAWCVCPGLRTKPLA